MFNVRYNRFLSFIIIALIMAGFGALVYAITAGAVVSDTVRVSPVLLEPLSSAKLLDKSTLSIYNPSAESSSVIMFDKEIKLKHIKVYGKASHKITLSYLKSEDTWVKINNLESINLSNASDTWNSYNVTGDVTAKAFKLETEPVGGNNGGIAEIEFWAEGSRADIKNGTSLFYLADTDNAPTYTKKTAASPAEASVIVERVKDKTTVKEAVFTFNNGFNASDINKAWLVYELKGFAGYISTEKTVNGKGVKKSWPMPGTSEWAFQAESINPDLLVNGSNEIRFSLPAGSAAGYDIKNLCLMVETDAGVNNVITVVSDNTTVSNLTDGDNSTAFKPALKSETIDFILNRPAQAEALLLNITENFAGTLAVFGLDNNAEDLISATVNAASLTTGWNTIELKNINNYSSYKIKMELAEEGKGAIAELMVKSSGVGAARAKGINITYPDNGQYYGRSAYITGYIPVMDNGSGEAQVLVGPVVASLKDGVFGAIVSKEDVGLESQADVMPWSVDVTVLYPDGDKIKTKVYLTAPQGYYVDADGQVVQNGDESVTYGFGVKGTGKKKFKLKNVEIEMDMEDSEKSTNIQVLELDGNDIPPMDMGMVNVTGKGKKAFRFLPHKSRFKKKMKMRLPYDRKKIPAGKTEKDVNVYYFNESLNRWLPVEMEQVDKATEESVCLTDHFTDFVNAVIVTPDTPQMQSFNPNQIKDLKAALPGAGITMIEPPQPNNKGDAVLNYQIDIPPGRKGMQPQVVLSYNSAGGDGVLGYGWDLPLRSVSVDTRWGSPRFDQDNESESYSLEGELLVPNARYASVIQRSDNKYFYSETEKEFKRIKRLENSTSGYSWEVVDKSGTKYVYGSSSNSRLPQSGNISMWLLESVTDKFGNNIKYYYAFNNYALTAENPDTYGAIAGTVNVQLDHITYTGFGASDGKYSVYFSYKPAPYHRTDGKSGFLRTQGILLKDITVKYDNDVVRQYKMTYINGPLNKQLLESVDQCDSSGNVLSKNNTVFGRHTFDYYDDLAEENNMLFSDKTAVWKTNVDSLNTDNIAKKFLEDYHLSSLFPSGFLNLIDVSAINGNVSESSGETYSIKGGCDLWFINITVEVMWGYNNAEGHGIYSLLDVNGDGLVDQVYRSGGKVLWKKNLYSNNDFFENVFDGERNLKLTDGSNVEDFSRDSQKSTMIGAGVSLGSLVGSLGASINGTSVDVVQRVYMTDSNSDRMPDLVNNGTVYFGTRDKDDPDNIIYDKISTNTENPVKPETAIAADDIKDEDLQLLHDKVKANPLIDGLRRWKAPFTGVVNITSIAKLKPLPDKNGNEIRNSDESTFDGVYLSIQKDDSFVQINGQNYLEMNTAEVDINVTGLQVQRGDDIYFREQSIYDGTYDDIIWNPEIEYTHIEGNAVETSMAPDENGFSQTAFSAAEEFTLAGRRGIAVTMMFTGKVKLDGDLVKTGVLTDDVTLRIMKKSVDSLNPKDFTYINNPADASQTILTDVETGVINMPAQEIDVQKGDSIGLLLDCDSNIDINNISWNPRIYYTEIPEDLNVPVPPVMDGEDYNVQMYIPYDVMFYPNNEFGVVSEPFKVDENTAWLKLNDFVEKLSDFSDLVLRVSGKINFIKPLTGNITVSAIGTGKLGGRDGVERIEVLKTIYPQNISYQDNCVAIDASFVPSDKVAKFFLATEDLFSDSNIKFLVTVDNEEDVDSFVWYPKAVYCSNALKELPENNPQLAATVPNSPYEVYVKSTGKRYVRNLSIQPSFSLKPYQVQTDTEEIYDIVAPSTNMILNEHPEIMFTVKSQNKTIFKHLIKINHYDQDVMPFSRQMEFGEEYYFSCNARHPYFGKMLNNYEGTIVPVGLKETTSVQIPLYTDEKPSLFAASYRGWAYAGVKGNPPVAANPTPEPVLPGSTFNINTYNSNHDLLLESKLVMPEDDGDGEPLREIDPVVFLPVIQRDKETGEFIRTWQADEGLYVSASSMSSSRGGRKSIGFLGDGELAPMVSGEGSVAVNRVSRSNQVGVQFNAGISLGPLGGSIGGFGSIGNSTSLADYMDMNGDGFADIVTANKIQYTRPDGGLGGEDDILQISSRKSVVGNAGYSVGQSMNPPITVPDAKGTNKSGGSGAMTKPFIGFSLSKNQSSGNANVTRDFIDMNGDGLPDLVELSNTNTNDLVNSTGANHLKVRYNTGYNFTDAYDWIINNKVLAINKTQSVSGGAALGLNAGLSGDNQTDYSTGLDDNISISVSGGVSGGMSSSTTIKAIMDINGDGLPDFIDQNGDVGFNTGKGFLPPQEVGLDEYYITSSSVFGGSSYGFSISVPILGICYVGGSYGKADGKSLSKQERGIMDVNGDGKPDKVKSSNYNLNVVFNNIGKTNLLKSIQRPMKAVINLEYDKSEHTVKMPNFKWNLAGISATDGVVNNAGNAVDQVGNDDLVIDIRYEDGVYDKFNKEFLGYKNVIQVQELGLLNGIQQYRETARQYFNEQSSGDNLLDYYKRGLLIKETIKNPSDGMIFKETDYQYNVRIVIGDQYPVIGISSACAELELITEKYYGDGGGAPGNYVEIQKEYDYNSMGDVISYIESSDSYTDDITVDISYDYTGNLQTLNSNSSVFPVNLPLTHIVKQGNNYLRQKSAYYDSGNSYRLENIKAYIDGSNPVSSDVETYSQSYAVTSFDYDTYGNIIHVYMPYNDSASHDRASFTYTYDSNVNTYVTGIVDNFGNQNTMTYDYEYGMIESVTDNNDNVITYHYDEFTDRGSNYGRLDYIVGPNEQGTDDVTVEYDYHPEADIPYAVTKNYSEVGADPIEVITFTDGFGKVIQTQKTADIFVGDTASEMMAVSGSVIYDKGGRVRRQYLPGRCAAGTGYFTHSANDRFMTTEYNNFDKITEQTDLNNRLTRFQYEFTSEGLFKTVMTDSNNNSKSLYKDVNSRVKSIVEYDTTVTPNDVITTDYNYDVLGQIKEVIQHKGDSAYTTFVEYDNLGRRISIDNPDTGLVEYGYDTASNLISKTTPNLRVPEPDTPILYSYDYNRLMTVTYPAVNGAGADVITYTYGTSSEAGNTNGNLFGRVKIVSYNAGSREFSYDRLGNAKYQKDIIGAFEYETEFVFDNFGRAKTITYPDDEVVTYSYDAGGLVNGVSGVKGGNTTNYVTGVLYDEFGQRKRIVYGNGTQTDYEYNTEDRRLASLTTTRISDSAVIQDINYDYDSVGNITGIEKSMDVSMETYPQNITYSYNYDGFYRLKTTDAFIYDNTVPSAKVEKKRLEVDMTYDSIHNITSKSQYITNNYGQEGQSQYGYNNTYVYDVTVAGNYKPHAAGLVGNTLDINSNPPKNAKDFSFDINGNNTGYNSFGQYSNPLSSRVIAWDAENRLISLTDTDYMRPSTYYNYNYNDKGDRVFVSISGLLNQYLIYYPNQYFTKKVQTGQPSNFVETKNYYLNNQRIASWVTTNSTSEKYYYHNDHLGSTAILTDSSALLKEHIEYTPWGESWYENGGITNYKFTGKELDPTGLYYFGARYYDPQVSLWMSTDSAIEKYLQTDGKGIYDSSNFSLYAYCGNNPLKFIDPDGNIKVIARFVTGDTEKTAKADRHNQYFSNAQDTYFNKLYGGSELVIPCDVENGEQLQAALEGFSSLDPEKGITTLIIIGHAGPEGFYGKTRERNGLQSNADTSKGGRTVEQLANDPKIKFNKNFVAMLLGCKTGSGFDKNGNPVKSNIVNDFFNALKNVVEDFSGIVTGNRDRTGEGSSSSKNDAYPYVGDVEQIK